MAQRPDDKKTFKRMVGLLGVSALKHVSYKCRQILKFGIGINASAVFYT